jgi:hypothetical protein
MKRWFFDEIVPKVQARAWRCLRDINNTRAKHKSGELKWDRRARR